MFLKICKSFWKKKCTANSGLRFQCISYHIQFRLTYHMKNGLVVLTWPSLSNPQRKRYYWTFYTMGNSVIRLMSLILVIYGCGINPASDIPIYKSVTRWDDVKCTIQIYRRSYFRVRQTYFAISNLLLKSGRHHSWLLWLKYEFFTKKNYFKIPKSLFNCCSAIKVEGLDLLARIIAN